MFDSIKAIEGHNQWQMSGISFIFVKDLKFLQDNTRLHVSLVIKLQLEIRHIHQKLHFLITIYFGFSRKMALNSVPWEIAKAANILGRWGYEVAWNMVENRSTTCLIGCLTLFLLSEIFLLSINWMNFYITNKIMVLYMHLLKFTRRKYYSSLPIPYHYCGVLT